MGELACENAGALGAPDLRSWYSDGLQRCWDATSLAPLLACERRYGWQVAEGRGIRSRALEWGIALHTGSEAQERALCAGAARADALHAGLRAAWEHSNWSTPDAPDKPWRTREALARALCWREEQWGAVDPVTIDRLPDGTPLIEQRFMLPGGTYPDGRAWWLCGRLDGRVCFGGRRYVRDIKSTGSALTEWYWRRYAPGVQMALYDAASTALWGEAHDGVMVEACQLGAGFVRWERRFVPTNAALRADALAQIGAAVERAYAAHASARRLPNFTACGFCDFRAVCESAGAVRPGLLEADFPRGARWAPTGA